MPKNKKKDCPSKEVVLEPPKVKTTKEFSEVKKTKEKKLTGAEEHHALEHAVNYIENNMGPNEKEYSIRYSKQKGWSLRYYIYRSLRDFFQLQKDEKFDGEKFR